MTRWRERWLATIFFQHFSPAIFFPFLRSLVVDGWLCLSLTLSSVFLVVLLTAAPVAIILVFVITVPTVCLRILFQVFFSLSPPKFLFHHIMDV
jgi:hypothetical protein